MIKKINQGGKLSHNMPSMLKLPFILNSIAQIMFESKCIAAMGISIFDMFTLPFHLQVMSTVQITFEIFTQVQAQE